METGSVSNTFTGFWDHTPHTGSPCLALIHGEGLNLTTTGYNMFIDFLQRLAKISLFLHRVANILGKRIYEVNILHFYYFEISKIFVSVFLTSF